MLRQQIYRSKCLPIYQDVRFLIIYVQWGLFYNCKNNQSILAEFNLQMQQNSD